MINKTILNGSTILGAVFCAAMVVAPAQAQQSGTTTDDTDGLAVGDIIVTGARDLAGVVQAKDSSTLFGIDKPIVDTPRSITAISDKLLSRYSIKTVYDFTAVAAGTYTSSYFGVPGSLNIRGSIADNYFNGFLGVANIANFPTPVDATSNIEIVRGPPSPIFGAGQVGGFLNFIPKSARGQDTRYISEFGGTITATGGSYDEKEGTLQLNFPLSLGGNSAGVSLFGKVEDSGSFYRGMKPKSQVFQGSFGTEVGEKATFDLTYQFIHSDGYFKNIGWNRATQQLIDDGLYLSGHPIRQIVTPGMNYIDAAAFNAVNSVTPVSQFVLPSFGVNGRPNDYTRLDPATVKLVKLDPRTTYIDPDYDVNEARTHTVYAGFALTPSDHHTVKLENFLETLNSRNYQSYGFSTKYRGYVTEQRLSYTGKFDFGGLKLQAVVGVSHRYTKAHDLASLDDGVLIEDRRDLSVGPTPDDRLNYPFVPGFVWAEDTKSNITDLAAFGLFDATYGPVSLTLGGRFDNYDVTTRNTGSKSTDRSVFTGSDSPFSYNASLSFKSSIATLYGTYAKAASLQQTQGGAIRIQQIPGNQFIGESELKEIGIKTSQLGGRFYAAIALYDQKRSYLDSRTSAVLGNKGRGIEGELRYLVTAHLGVTATATYQKLKQLAPVSGTGAFYTLPPYLAGVANADGYGGYWGTRAGFLGMTGEYDLRNSPDFNGNFFVTYDSGTFWGATAGVSYSGETGGTIANSIRIPGYALAKLGLYATVGKTWRADVNFDNLFDKRYFIPNFDVDSNVNVLPGIGRRFHIKLTKTF